MKFDIHCHLESKDYEGIKALLIECNAKNISVILNGLDYEINKEVLKLAANFKNVFASLGMHPSSAFDSKVISQITENKDELVAIGEVGLDFKEGFSTEQVNNFKKMIKLANDLRKPLIIHSRNAEKEVIFCLESVKVPSILHCFSGKKKLITEALKNPMIYFSVPAMVNYSEQFQELVKQAPLERLMCETDSPYLWKNGINTPLNIIHAYEKISQLKGIKVQDCELIIEKTAKTIFKIREFKNN